MTLKTELPPMSIQHKSQRVYHHHYYHQQQNSLPLQNHNVASNSFLDHHQIHICNTSVQSHSVILSYNQHKRAFDSHEQPPQETISDTKNIELPHRFHHNHDHHLRHHIDDPIIQQLLKARGLTQVPALPLKTQQDVVTNSAATTAAATANVGDTNHCSSLIKQKQRSQIQFFLLSAFAYILSPIDLIPEMIFGIFGILDDLLFLFLCLFCIAIILICPVFTEMRRVMLTRLKLVESRPSITENKQL